MQPPLSTDAQFFQEQAQSMKAPHKNRSGSSHQQLKILSSPKLSEPLDKKAGTTTRETSHLAPAEWMGQNRSPENQEGDYQGTGSTMMQVPTIESFKNTASGWETSLFARDVDPCAAATRNCHQEKVDEKSWEVLSGALYQPV